MDTIYRKLEDKDRRFIDVDLNKPKKRMTSREKFQVELSKNEKEATKNGLPFARHAAKDDFENSIKSQRDAQIRKYGSIEHPEELKVPEMNWKQYSDLKNFKLINEKERSDDNLSTKNPGLAVTSQVKTYKYKDYGQTYTVMEDGPSSIKRAIKNRAKLDKQISKELD